MESCYSEVRLNTQRLTWVPFKLETYIILSIALPCILNIEVLFVTSFKSLPLQTLFQNALDRSPGLHFLLP